jgi:hypothetical protein
MCERKYGPVSSWKAPVSVIRFPLRWMIAAPKADVLLGGTSLRPERLAR